MPTDSAAEPIISADQVLLLKPAIRKAISSMYARYAEPVTLSRLASEVFVSPFHFSRVFAKATGVTPGRYLTAIRLFEAKQLLLGTDLTVSDVVCSVGYSSVGTFTSRFTRAVGMTPTQYRDPEVRQLMVAISPHYQRLPTPSALRAAGIGCASRASGVGAGLATIAGRIELPHRAGPANVLIGVFGELVPQSSPMAWVAKTNVTTAGEFEIRGVPVGARTLIAIAEHASGAEGLPFSIGTTPCSVGPGPARHGARIRLRESRPTDPPIAITLATPTGPIGRSEPRRRRLDSVA